MYKNIYAYSASKVMDNFCSIYNKKKPENISLKFKTNTARKIAEQNIIQFETTNR